jgi:hypothetical protein
MTERTLPSGGSKAVGGGVGAGARRGGRSDSLGKRDKPDGRQMQPPRKRLAAGGDHDPGFQS